MSDTDSVHHWDGHRDDTPDYNLLTSMTMSFLQELPSYRSIAQRRTTILGRDKSGGTLLKPASSENRSFLEPGKLEKEHLGSQSIRKYALNISEKRRLREIQEAQVKYLSEWDQWKQYSTKSWKRFIEETKELFSHLELWKNDIRSIEGIDVSCIVE